MRPFIKFALVYVIVAYGILLFGIVVEPQLWQSHGTPLSFLLFFVFALPWSVLFFMVPAVGWPLSLVAPFLNLAIILGWLKLRGRDREPVDPWKQPTEETKSTHAGRLPE